MIIVGPYCSTTLEQKLPLGRTKKRNCPEFTAVSVGRHDSNVTTLYDNDFDVTMQLYKRCRR